MAEQWIISAPLQKVVSAWGLWYQRLHRGRENVVFGSWARKDDTVAIWRIMIDGHHAGGFEMLATPGGTTSLWYRPPEGERRETLDAWFKEMREGLRLNGFTIQQPVTPEPASTKAGGEQPRVPSRQADKRKWRATWEIIEAEWRKGKSYEQISGWLAKSHPELYYTARTLQDIIAAGEADLLNE